MIHSDRISIKTGEGTDIRDITSECRKILSASGMSDGIVVVFCPGSTGGVTTLEYEPNLLKDLDESLDIFAPAGKEYHHKKTWNDDNGSGHIRSSIVGPSLTIPVENGKMTLGTWQQIVFCDFDAIPRSRELIVQILGE